MRSYPVCRFAVLVITIRLYGYVISIIASLLCQLMQYHALLQLKPWMDRSHYTELPSHKILTLKLVHALSIYHLFAEYILIILSITLIKHWRLEE